MEVVPVGNAAFTDYSDSCFSRWNWSGLMRNIDIERLNYYDDIVACCMGICYLGTQYWYWSVSTLPFHLILL